MAFEKSKVIYGLRKKKFETLLRYFAMSLGHVGGRLVQFDQAR